MADYEPYEASQEDIDKVIAYMKTTDPENATPEYAIEFLKKYQTIFHGLGTVLTDEEMKKLYDEFAEDRQSN
jgi:hypothetical protein